MKLLDKVLVVFGVTTVLTVASIMGYTLFVTKDSEVAKASTTSTTSQTTSAATPMTSQQTSSAGSTATTYADGTFAATTSYNVPEGDTNSVSVNMTVKDGVITAVSATHDYPNRQSGRFTDWFDQELQAEVVGKSLGGLSVSRVGGASLTSNAFDDVLDTIRNDAKA